MKKVKLFTSIFVMVLALVFAGCKHSVTEPEPEPQPNANSTYTVTVATGITNGTVTADKTTAQKDDTVTLTISANSGYELESVSVKDADNNDITATTVTAGTTYTFVMPESNITVSATFKLKYYVVTIDNEITNGTIATEAVWVTKGSGIDFSVYANSGYEVISISVKDEDNNDITITELHGGSYTFFMPASNVILSATFREITGITGSEVFIAGRNITIRPALWACDHEVTQAEYQSVMGSNPSYFTNNPAEGETRENRPVENVSWYDCLVYCNKRSMSEGLTPCYTIGGKTNPSEWGAVPITSNATWDEVKCNFDANGYRLPTEAEWEYLARGGNLTDEGQTAYSGSDTIENVAWYSDNSGNKTHEVKKKAKNALDLYDMSGNVWEWCWDWYGSISSGTPSVGASSGSRRVLRGGSLYYNAGSCTVSYRFSRSPTNQLGNFLGFRVVRSTN